MQDNFNIQKLRNDYLKKIITENEIVKLIISILEVSNTPQLVIEALELIEELSLKNRSIYELLEDLLISEENPMIRSVVAKMIIKFYLKEAVSPLKWTIQNEKSSIVFKSIFEALNNSEIQLIQTLKKELLHSIFGVQEEEITFFLDLESIHEELSVEKIDFFKKYRSEDISQVLKGKALYAVKNGHVVALNLFGWETDFESILSYNYQKFRKATSNIKSLPRSIALLKQLEHLDLSNFDALETLPHEIGNLTNLRILKLRNCTFLKYLPQSVGNLEKLEVLDLSNSFYLETIPDTIGKLVNLRELILGSNLGYVMLRNLPNTIGDLKRLEVLKLKSCSKLTKIPESIGRLTRLKILNLSHCINLKELPDSINKIKSLEIIWDEPIETEKLSSNDF
ncbi:MAG: hypothetical protein JW891_06405 [Candidatus Lokiarchaeota archaeon]|nr:hypothetical protein [Candidatus Lokiarchaeota archaeon]